MSVGKLVERSGLPRSTVSAAVNGVSRPRDDTVDCIADALALTEVEKRSLFAAEPCKDTVGNTTSTVEIPTGVLLKKVHVALRPQMENNVNMTRRPVGQPVDEVITLFVQPTRDDVHFKFQLVVFAAEAGREATVVPRAYGSLPDVTVHRYWWDGRRSDLSRVRPEESEILRVKTSAGRVGLVAVYESGIATDQSDGEDVRSVMGANWVHHRHRPTHRFAVAADGKRLAIDMCYELVGIHDRSALDLDGTLRLKPPSQVWSFDELSDTTCDALSALGRAAGATLGSLASKGVTARAVDAAARLLSSPRELGSKLDWVTNLRRDQEFDFSYVIHRIQRRSQSP